VNAQYVLKAADAQFELYNYEKAIELYTEAYQKKNSLKATERLADSYRMLRDFKQAASWYALLVQMEGVKPEAYKLYGDMLRAISKYSEAKVQYEKYERLAKSPSPELSAQVKKWIVSCDSAVRWMADPEQVEITNVNAINTAKSEWGGVVYGKGMVFTSDRDYDVVAERASKPFLKWNNQVLPNDKTYGWTGNGYLKLFQQDDSGGIFLFPIPVSGVAYHIGSATFSADEKEVYFTLSRIPDKLSRNGRQPSTVNIEIYSSRKQGDSWSKPEPFRYNNVLKWSVGDPFLSSDGKQLYFVSDMPGGKGGTDIYVCNRTADGKWSAALNLFMVNSIGNERTPWVDGNTMYFSSDAGISMGGLDIFKANAKTGLVTNMGYPFNSPQDDFAFRLTGKLTGYFSSNREGGKGSDDIYSFVAQEKQMILVQGKLLDKQTGGPLTNAVITLTKLGGTPVKLETDKNGAYNYKLEEGTTYDITVEKSDYITLVTQFKAINVNTGKMAQSLALERVSVGEPIRIENIYYDFGKSTIREDAKPELEKLVLLMKQNPTFWVTLSSHTDSRGNDELNLRLSQARADAAVKYIVARGIHKNRIKAVGYGENKPVNECKNGVWCPIEKHKMNRRTEFTITKQ
jgi:outer membrane protein OmpA-like peptidoglycan-associated protein